MGQRSTFHWAMVAVIGTMIAAVTVDLFFLRYRFPSSDGLNLVSFFLPLGSSIWYCRWAKHQRLTQATSMFGWAVAVGVFTPALVFMAARSAMPLRDRFLASCDQAIGLETPTVLNFVGRYHWMNKTFWWSYSSLPVLIALSAILPLVFGKFQAAREYLISVSFAILTGAALFALVPAVGPWSVYPMKQTPMQTWCGHMVLTLRLNGLYNIVGNDAGFVSFPSFHVVLALLSAVCLGSAWRAVRVPVGVLAGLICVSTITTGWHYVTDVVGGLVLTILAIAAARMFRRLEKREAPCHI
jgi:membrane-associated phospholipid phosphatase